LESLLILESLLNLKEFLLFLGLLEDILKSENPPIVLGRVCDITVETEEEGG
jgi:hypothetical protein